MKSSIESLLPISWYPSEGTLQAPFLFRKCLAMGK